MEGVCRSYLVIILELFPKRKQYFHIKATEKCFPNFFMQQGEFEQS